MVSAFTWSLGGDDANAFALSSSGVLTFDPAPNFEAPTDSAPRNVYEVTIQATDESATDAAATTGELAVSVTVEDVDEPPEIDGFDSYTIVENSSTFVGSYTASDPEGDDTTWLSLTGTDARHFTLDEFGTLSFVETPDYDRETNGNHGDTYYVILRASDEGNRIGSLPVTITLEDEPEPPVIGGPVEATVSEVVNPTPNQVVMVGTYTKHDPEGGATNWGAVGSSAVLTGADEADFEFDQPTGRLTFAAPPDYEEGGARYEVTVNANDGSLDGDLDVTVAVNNVEETGSLTLGAQRGVNGELLKATLTDPDGVASQTWTWQRSAEHVGPVG